MLGEGVGAALCAAVCIGERQRAVLRGAGEGGEVERLSRAVDGVCVCPIVTLNGQAIVRFAAADEQKNEQQRQ